MLVKAALSSLLLAASFADASPVKLDTRSDDAVATGLTARSSAATLSQLLNTEFTVPAPLVKTRGKKIRRANAVGNNVRIKNSKVQGATLYTVELDIGTPAQTVVALPDTGSADLLVPSRQYDYKKTSTGHYYFRNTTFNFVTGSFRGVPTTDKVSILPGQNVSQWFGLTAEMPYGIMGLSFQSLASLAKPTFSSLVSSGQIAAAKFGLFLSRFPSATGYLTLGAFNSNFYTGTVTTLANVASNRWALLMTGYTVDGASAATSTATIIDSGSIQSYVPKTIAAAIFKAIPGAYLDPEPQTVSLNGQDYVIDNYIYPCNSTLSPGFSFYGGGSTQFTFNPLDYNLQTIDSKNCYASIMGVDIELNGTPAALLGSDFLRSWYGMFDFANAAFNNAPTIAFAKTPEWIREL
ncbi:hypothetical protein JCM11641_002882 [Rhodosporidiobolus odoratus]